ncbi:beta-glucuronidase-like [Ischnura elegans]|uniref:beta-glucuronidase-like n=1 Tax=Ischnura elegans TaxID=197161 RepID=UPI001ED88AB4|nr:beta-glucuronidase-like [Ischnura elegans]
MCVTTQAFSPFLIFSVCIGFSFGLLYPRESETRDVRSLDGLWNFRTDQKGMGILQNWEATFLSETGPTEIMPVPSSYNDITAKSSVRDHIGLVWYDRKFFTPRDWALEGRKVFIRFGSIHYYAYVWINGVLVTTHEGGHLPFEEDITAFLNFGKSYDHITVAINNTLTPTTIPQGQVKFMNDSKRYPKGYMEQSFNFDFFNYAGIHRSVLLYTTPPVYIEDISIFTSFTKERGTNDNTGIIWYDVSVANPGYSENSVESAITCRINVYEGWDLNGAGVNTTALVATAMGCNSVVEIPKVKLWWPFLMDSNPGFLYTLEILLNKDGSKDVYRMPAGVRTIEWKNNEFLINKKSFYFHGFGRHEDSNIIGRGESLPLAVKDSSLINWIGANSFRTSHYPYSEKIMDLADRLGIVVIDECPAIGINNFTQSVLLEKHKRIMTELIQRDKNRPSVVLWSLSNEPLSQEKGADVYFSTLVNHTKALDSSRPVTFVTSQQSSNDKAVQFMDVICVNRYSSWYSDTGHSDLIVRQTISEMSAWHEKFNKPIIMSEYGAGSISGFHSEPSFLWTEEYQAITLKKHFEAFDILRQKGFLIGEMIWNFADFATPAEYFRPGGCMKGVFTRERKPKLAAHITRRRYWSLANSSFHVPLPEDLLI